jgi:hypothetical protein
MPSIREAIEALREELRKRVIDVLLEVGSDDHMDRGTPVGVYADRIFALFPNDLTDAALPHMPTSKQTVTLNGESLREAAENLLRKASSLVYSGPLVAEMNALQAALSRPPSKPEEPVYVCITCGKELYGLAFCEDCSGNVGLQPLLNDIKTTIEECVGLVPKIDARGIIAVRAGRNILRKIGIFLSRESAPAKPPAPQSVTMTQPKIDFVLDLSQAEADRLGPPMRHRCAIDPGWHNMSANCFGIKEIER